MVRKNNSNNSDKLSIIKYLEIYKFIKLDFNKIGKGLIFQSINLNNKIFKLEKSMNYKSNIINEIID